MNNRQSFFEFTRYAYKMRGGSIDNLLHCHPQYEILYIDEAACDYVVGDRVIALQPGDLFILNGLARHCPVKVDRDTYVRTVLVFEPHLIDHFHPNLRAVDPLLPFKAMRNFHLRLDGETKRECESILKKINTYYNKGDPVEDTRLILAFYDLLMFVYTQCRPLLNRYENSPPSKELYVQKVIDYIEAHYWEDIRLEQIEASIHMSKFYLAKIFHETTGMTIFDYVMSRRISQAKLLFRHDQNSSVTSVCHLVGFKNLAHFSRVFKKLVGVSPSEYRKPL